VVENPTGLPDRDQHPFLIRVDLSFVLVPPPVGRRVWRFALSNRPVCPLALAPVGSQFANFHVFVLARDLLHSSFFPTSSESSRCALCRESLFDQYGRTEVRFFFCFRRIRTPATFSLLIVAGLFFSPPFIDRGCLGSLGELACFSFSWFLSWFPLGQVITLPPILTYYSRFPSATLLAPFFPAEVLFFLFPFGGF